MNLPIETPVPYCLASIPEYIVENIVVYFYFILTNRPSMRMLKRKRIFSPFCCCPWAMLNYFLLHLVGPTKGNLKVCNARLNSMSFKKDKKEFEFDPARTVLENRIYINLEKSDRFCLAVSQDGRSYSALFSYAPYGTHRKCSVCHRY